MNSSNQIQTALKIMKLVFFAVSFYLLWKVGGWRLILGVSLFVGGNNVDLFERMDKPWRRFQSLMEKHERAD